MAENIFPYELPENWHWSTLGKVCKLAKGEKIFDEKFPYLDVKYLRGTNEKNFVESGNYVEEGSKLILVDGENSGEIFTVHENGYMGSTLRELKIFEIVDANFFQYFVSTKKELYRQNKRGSAIPHLNKNLFYSTPIPLPPLDEQKRIVAVIESLFEKLDAAKSIVQKVLDGYELRRAAILHKAFTGNLTKNFRAEHGFTLDDWQEKKFSDVLFPTENTKPTGKNFRYIDIDSIDNKRQQVRAPKIIETEKAPSRAIRKIKENDVLFSMVRPYLKNIALIDENLQDCIASSGFFVCRCTENLSSKFLYNFLCSENAISYLMQFMKGDNSPSIRRDEFLSLSVNLPSIDEQKEIVRVLADLLDKEQRTKEIAEKILSEIDVMKRTILARAFRGELGTKYQKKFLEGL